MAWWRIRSDYNKSNDSVRFGQNLARQKASVDVQVAAVNKWLESGKLPQELIPLYKVLWKPKWYSLLSKAKLAKFGAVKTTLGSGHEQLRKSMDKTKEYLHELEMDLEWVVLNMLPQKFLRKSWTCSGSPEHATTIVAQEVQRTLDMWRRPDYGRHCLVCNCCDQLRLPQH